MPKSCMPIVAIMYDFDKTLCTKDMQEYTFIPKVKMTADEFWKEARDLAVNNKMDRILAYMKVMLDRAHNVRARVTRDEFVKLGENLELYPGVNTWFKRINSLGKDLGLRIEHYIISSGLKEIIEGSCIYKYFKDVFACEFLYDENGVACWPKTAVNFTTKTQFLFRINKGVHDVSNESDLNKYVVADDRRVPFGNMIYIGDGMTDIPCMKLVKVNGGYSIAVYPKNKKGNANQLLKDNRVSFIEVADYSEDSELSNLMDNILYDIAGKNQLISLTKRQKSLVK